MSTTESSKNSKSSVCSSESPLLPPCEVCHGKASGYHYGAITCEACKIFFRRCLAERYVYKCKKEEKCEIGPKRRQTCSFCRLKKCHDIGMSKDGCFKGRYSLSRKSDCIRLAKGETSISQKTVTSSTSKSHKRALRTPEQIELYESIIKGVTEADTLNAVASKEFLESLPELEAKVLEQQNLLKATFGIEPISKESYREVYRETGIDIDGRREKLSNCMATSDGYFEKYLGFLKALPGFQNFTMNDRIKLAQSQVGMACWNLMSSKLYCNLDKNLYTCPFCMQTYTKDDFHALNTEEYIEVFTGQCKLVRDLHLSAAESAMVMALASLSTDFIDGIENRKDIEKQELIYLESLVYLLEKRQQQDPTTLGGIFHLLANNRIEAEVSKKNFNSLMEEHSDIVITNLSPIGEAMMDDEMCSIIQRFKQNINIE